MECRILRLAEQGRKVFGQLCTLWSYGLVGRLWPSFWRCSGFVVRLAAFKAHLQHLDLVREGFAFVYDDDILILFRTMTEDTCPPVLCFQGGRF